MKKTVPVLFAVLLLTAIFVYVSQAQTPQKGSKNTMTLPSGEVVYDLNGEWDVVSENYGAWGVFGTHQDIFKIIQEGNSFVAIRTRGNPYMPPGSTGTRGELDKNGFKKVFIITFTGPIPAEGRISEDGNKIVIDEGAVVRQTFTRK
jgi:hypothetical protein